MKRFAAFAVLWLGLAGLAAITWWDELSLTVWNALLVLVFGPPAVVLFTILGELLGGLYQRLPGVRHANMFVESRTRSRQISGLRILWYLVSSLLLIAVVLGLTWVYRSVV